VETIVAQTVVVIGNILAVAAVAGALAAAAAAAAVAVAVAVDAVAGAAVVSARAVPEIFPHQSMLRRKAAKLAATIVATADIRTAARRIVAHGAISTIAVRIPHALLLLPNRPKNRLCCRANHLRNIVAARCRKLLLPFRLPNPNASNRRPKQKTRSHA
jgi:hypothetical protein